MASFASPSKAIQNVHIQPFPLRPLHAKIVREGDTVVAVTAHGAVYSNRFNKKVHYGFGNWNGAEDMLYALVKLGRVPQSEVDDHVAKANEREKADESLWEVEAMARAAQRLDMTLTRDVQVSMVAKVRANYNHFKANEVMKKLEKLGIDPKLLTPIPMP